MKLKLLGLLLVAGFAIAPAAARAEFLTVMQVVQSIGNNEYLSAASRADTAPAVRIVRLSTLAGAGYGAARLDTALYFKAVDIIYLQSALWQNPIAVTAMRNAGVSVNQIVSITMPGDRSATIYADDLGW